MRVSIFSRLVIGHLSIFLLVMGVAVYAILQLQQFDDVIRSVLNTDNRIIDFEKRLTDTLLSQILYERKFALMRDDALYRQFILAKEDFEGYLQAALSLADSSRGRDFLLRARENHRSYLALVEEEAAYLKTGQLYSQDRYVQEKQKMTNAVMEQLTFLRIHSQQGIFEKMKRLDEAGVNARRVAMVMAGVALLFGVTLSFLITRSITRPMSLMKTKTREIAQGNLEDDLNLSSPPEIAELAGAFNFMCEKLKALDKMKSDFFSSMSHELRTPLTSIKEGAGLLLDRVGGTVTDKQARLLTIIAEESNRLIGLVNSLLDLSKMEAGMMSYTFEKARFAPLIHEVMTGIEPLAKAKKISLHAEIGEELPAIRMDSERILQVLRNLVGNAVKFTPGGGDVSVSARLAGYRVKVSVSDTGPGIPKGDLTAIFDKFGQANLAVSPQADGTGLGLAIAKHIVSAHGGTIWAESEPGQGSVFFFFLPA